MAYCAGCRRFDPETGMMLMDQRVDAHFLARGFTYEIPLCELCRFNFENDPGYRQKLIFIAAALGGSKH